MRTKKAAIKKPGVIDLFSGAGGLSLGAARAGFQISGAVEMDKHAYNTHRCNFPDSTHLQEDVSKLRGQDLRERLNLINGELAGIVGGPPCQGFSPMGKNDASDSRNNLFVDFFRIVAEAQPKFFLAENVPGILVSKNEKLRNKAFAQIEEDYVLLPPMIMCASDFGAPTTRTRAFFFGYKKDEMQTLTAEDFLPAPNTQRTSVRDALRGMPIKINPNWQTEKDEWRVVRTDEKGFFNSRLRGHVPEGVGDTIALERLEVQSRASGFLGTVHSKAVTRRFAKIEAGKKDAVSKSQRLDPKGFCPTLRAGTGSERGSFQAVRPLHPTEDRVITPREAARLQGFPDWFRFSSTKWHSFRQIGNSVSPILAEHVLSIIRRAVE